MFNPMSGGALPHRRYPSSYYAPRAYGLLDALERPELVRVSDASPSGTPARPTEGAGISPLRWLAGQVGLLDLFGDPDAAAQAPVPISAREPEEPGWFARAEARFRETVPPAPPPEMVRDNNGGVWRKDIYDLIEDIAAAEPEDEPALRRRIQEVLADAPQTRDRWFHYELSNRLDGDDPETIRAALRDWGHEESIRARELLSQLLPGIALAAGPLSRTTGRQPAPTQTSRYQERTGGRLGNAKTRALNARIARAWESKSWKHTGGATDIERNKVEEEYIPNPMRDFDMDGRKGSNYVDVTFTGPEIMRRWGPENRMTRVQSMTMDPRTGKPTLDELETLLKIYKRVGGNVIGVPKD
ncbi:MAG: hypothetical protein L0210_03195 [Rhodospirillales bacterium]|nr:hypothetical protein [Rhodospirillales bacterium]